MTAILNNTFLSQRLRTQPMQGDTGAPFTCIACCLFSYSFTSSSSFTSSFSSLLPTSLLLLFLLVLLLLFLFTFLHLPLPPPVYNFPRLIFPLFHAYLISRLYIPPWFLISRFLLIFLSIFPFVMFLIVPNLSLAAVVQHMSSL